MTDVKIDVPLSEDRFKTLFKNTPISTFVWQKVKNDLILIDFNDAAEKMTEGGVKDYLGVTATKMYKERLDILEDLNQCLNEGATISRKMEYFFQTTSRERILNVTYNFMRPDLVIVYTEDITDRNIAEQKLKESEEKSRLILENANDMIAVLNDKFEYEYINEPIFMKILGYSNDDLIGKNNLPLIHPDDRKRTIIAASKILRKRQFFNQLRFKHRNGGYKWLEVTAAIFFNKNGEKKILNIYRDISERKKAEQTLKDSKEKYRNLFNYISSGVAVYEAYNYGEDFIFKDFNLAGEKIDNVKKEGLIGNRVTEVFPGVKDFGLFEVFQRVWKTGKPERLPISMYKDKRISGWRENYVYKLPTGEIVAVYDDITDRKMAEQKLKESEEKFRTITEQSFMAIVINQDNKIVYANEALQTLMGYPIEEMLDWSALELFDVIHPDDRETAIERNKQLFIGKAVESKPNPYKIITKFGQIKWIEVFSKPIQLEGKNAIFSTLIDITDKRKAEEELIRINKLKSEIFTRASHELKTPLIAIKGYTDLLLELHKEEFDGMVLSSLNQIKRGCTIFEKTINDILNTAYLESDRMKLNLSREDLSFLIKYCITDLKGLALARNHEITVDVQDKLVTFFEKERIYEVLSNLIINAIKYTPPGGEIEVKSEIVENFYRISVRDNGIGFTEEDKEQIFKQFGKIERDGQGWDLVIEGTGLGLYISKKIVEKHDGKIWVESEGRDKGSTFYFTLPIIND